MFGCGQGKFTCAVQHTSTRRDRLHCKRVYIRAATELKGHMSNFKWVILATLVGVVVAGSACAQTPADQTSSSTTVTVDTSKADQAVDKADKAVDKAIDETKEAGDKAADDTKNFAEKSVDKTKEIAEATADKTVEVAKAVGSGTKKVVSTTGETITDTWINSRVAAKFVDESLLKDSNINVDTDDGVVTLKGHVTSNAGKARAAAIASGSEGVKRVVNELVIRAK